MLNPEKVIPLDTFIELSALLEQECETYSHSLYQCAVAAIAVSQQELARVIEMPTGSGKTWVYALIAKYYLKLGKRVTIIEPNNALYAQTTELLGGIDIRLAIATIDHFYQHPSTVEVVILNEYHHIVQNNGFTVANGGMTGLWMLRNRTAFFCTATSNRGLTRILEQVVSKPVVLTFSSEYELIHKVSPIEGNQIKCCATKEAMLEMVQDDIHNNYEDKPIIVIINGKDQGMLVDILKENNWSKYKIGATPDVLREIRSWH